VFGLPVANLKIRRSSPPLNLQSVLGVRVFQPKHAIMVIRICQEDRAMPPATGQTVINMVIAHVRPSLKISSALFGPIHAGSKNKRSGGDCHHLHIILLHPGSSWTAAACHDFNVSKYQISSSWLRGFWCCQITTVEKL